ncbi:MAG: hypothetical protein GXO97_06760 [Nitrospirae bacterium]|nr:hypothetical protein [Nitrospirota bacterium]
MEKLDRLLIHWQEHNEEHARSYRKWAEEAEASGFHKVAELLGKAHEETLKINSLFEEARKEVEKAGSSNNFE